MGKRRRSRGTWFPILPAFIGDGGGAQALTYFESQYILEAGLSTGEASSPAFIPILSDSTSNALTQDQENIQTLRDQVEGQEYTFDRVVGKVWGTLHQAITEVGPLSVLFCMAMAVLPVQDESPDSPSLADDDMAPLFSNNSANPWIWRRTWKLYNNALADVLLAQELVVNKGPSSIAEYGSVMDGGHVDTRGASRRVKRDHRLFMVVQAALTEQTGGFPLTDFPTITFGFDFRVHGGMRRSGRRSSF